MKRWLVIRVNMTDSELSQMTVLHDIGASDINDGKYDSYEYAKKEAERDLKKHGHDSEVYVISAWKALGEPHR